MYNTYKESQKFHSGMKHAHADLFQLKDYSGDISSHSKSSSLAEEYGSDKEIAMLSATIVQLANETWR